MDECNVTVVFEISYTAILSLLDSGKMIPKYANLFGSPPFSSSSTFIVTILLPYMSQRHSIVILHRNSQNCSVDLAIWQDRLPAFLSRQPRFASSILPACSAAIVVARQS
jgi:hypothetical protein